MLARQLFGEKCGKSFRKFVITKSLRVCLWKKNAEAVSGSLQ